jgi:hypothetical protein
MGLGRTTQVRPIHVRAKVFAADSAPGFAVYRYAQALAHASVPDRDRFTQVPNRGPASERELFLFCRRSSVDVREQFVHA